MNITSDKVDRRNALACLIGAVIVALLSFPAASASGRAVYVWLLAFNRAIGFTPEKNCEQAGFSVVCPGADAGIGEGFPALLAGAAVLVAILAIAACLAVYAAHLATHGRRDPGHPYLVDHEFQALGCPRGVVPLRVTDNDAQDLLATYAARKNQNDARLSEDILIVLQRAGYKPPAVTAVR